MYDFAEEFRAKIETLFNTEFGIRHPGIPIRWNGLPWAQPKKSMWVEITTRNNPETQVSVGRKFIVRTTGFVQLDVMIPEEQGIVAANKLAASAADIFAYRKFSGVNVKITFYEKHVDEAPSGPGFRRVMARVFFHYDGEREREGVQDLA